MNTWDIIIDLVRALAWPCVATLAIFAAYDLLTAYRHE